MSYLHGLNVGDFVFFWGNAILLFESAVKAGIISEAILPEYFSDSGVLAECFSAHLKPPFCDILMDGDAKVLFKGLEDLRTADIKCSGKLIYSQIFVQMAFNILDKTVI